MTTCPSVLITIGDPTGSGPELAVRAALDPRVTARCNPVVIGSVAVIESARRLVDSVAAIEVVSPDVLPDLPPSPSRLRVLPCGSLTPQQYEKGNAGAAAGEHTVEVARAAAQLVLAGRAAAVCSAPTSKVSLHLAGFRYEGLSDLFAEEAGAKGYNSLLVMGHIRLLQATGHVAYRRVPELLTAERVGEVITALHGALDTLFGIASPRLAVAGLNPHAGEGGLYGREELEVLAPAIESARARGIDVTGPVPADSLVPRIQAGRFDGAVAMYHDQAQIPLKVLGEHAPATLLLGLPLARTSVAHGTAYGKARTGTADPAGMIQATVLAAEVGPRIQRVRR